SDQQSGKAYGCSRCSLSPMRKYLRFISGLHTYLREQLDPAEALEQAREQLRQRIVAREKNFLSLVEKGIYGYERSPYRRLLQTRRIGFADVRKWVENNGVEETLTRLQQAGVYFTVDEFKGKAEVNRNGIRFRCQESAFDNPFLSESYAVRSGGTRSAGT